MYENLYFTAMLPVLLIWAVVFWFAKNQRKEMLIIGTFTAIIGPIQELWYTKDYWHPVYIGSWPWIEDIIFGFAVMGVAVVAYEILFSSRIREARKEPPHTLVFIALLAMIGLGMGFFVPFMNSIYAAILAFLLAWVVILFLRRDLLLPSLGSAVFLTTAAVIAYEIILVFAPHFFDLWWEHKNISGISLLRIPIEEYLWFFTAGLALGPLYEFWKGIRFVKKA